MFKHILLATDGTEPSEDAVNMAGLRQSGLGTGGIPYTFRDMRIEKMCVVKTP
jgi:hypothetical protein